MIELLKSHRVLICAGTGGVGKTSLSSSLGVLAARNGLRTLVLTIDPAQRLAQALGIKKETGVDVPVASVNGLWASMMDPRKEFDEFVLGSVDNGIARALFKNRLYQQLVSNLNGSQEFTSLLRLLNSVESEKYDLVILDTPPTQNAVDFLRAPEKLTMLFQDSVIGWFADTSENEGWLRRALHRGTRLVTSALESVTGSTFLAELKDFFTHISHLKGKIANISRRVNELLHSEKTGFVLITGFDESKLKEALEFQGDLRHEGLQLRMVVVNRWFPEWAEHTGIPEMLSAKWSQNPNYQVLKNFHAQFSEYFLSRQGVCEHLESQMGKSVPVLKLPDFRNTVQGIEDLNQVASTLQEKWRQHK